MSEPINVLLPELVVRPRGSYITYTGKETNRPSVADFIKSKAKEARVEAANKILKQYEPDVPTVTRSITPFNGLAGLVMSEKTRRDLFGIDPSPFTCLYTATTKYNDKDAIATSNKILKNDPQKYGYEPVNINNTEVGDLVQFSDNHLGGLAGKIIGPTHGTIVTDIDKNGKLKLSYSNGSTQPYEYPNEYAEEPEYTMRHDIPIGYVSTKLKANPSALRYVGSPTKQMEWADEYMQKFPRSSKKAEGGSLKEKSAWDNLSLAEKAEMIGIAVRNGLTTLPEIRAKYNEFAEGGREDVVVEDSTIVPFKRREEVIITPDTQYNQYLNTLPDNQRFTPNDKYDSYLYWKLNGKPKNFKEAHKKGMFTYDHSDDGYHANSIVFDDNTDVGYFMKPKDHDTVGFETDWFKKGLVTEEGGWQRPETFIEWKESQPFRDSHVLIDDPDRPNYYRYQPVERANGGGIHISPSKKGTFTAAASKHGKSVQEFASQVLAHPENYSPAMRKKANFARNSRRWKHGLGGNLFYEGGESNIFRRPDGTYFYQATPDSEQVAVTPLNTLFEDPALWTYTDESGRLYTPKAYVPTIKEGAVKEAVSHGPLIDAINNYYREGLYRAKNGTLALHGKYMLPIAGLAATGIGSTIEAPFATGMSIAEGYLGSLPFEWGSKILTGKDWSSNVSSLTGLDAPIASLTNPGAWIGGQAGYSGGKAIQRGVLQDRLLGAAHSPKEAELYKKIYGRDISELVDQTPWTALIKGSPNLGNEYGLFNKSNPLWNPRKNKTAFYSELGNYVVPFIGPGRTVARKLAANVFSQSSSPERDLANKSLKEFLTTKGNFNGIVDAEGITTDVERAYPRIDFNKYFLWRKDPILRWTYPVRTTAKYFRENPIADKVSFGEKYDLYGNIIQGKMPVESVETHKRHTFEPLFIRLSSPNLRKDANGITKYGIQKMEDNFHFGNKGEKVFEYNKWQGLNEEWNPDLPELNIGGHQVFLDTNEGTLLSKDIWKFNPWDWRIRWGEFGGSAAQAGLVDKLGTPFVTVSKNKLSPEAMLYIKSK